MATDVERLRSEHLAKLLAKCMACLHDCWRLADLAGHVSGRIDEAFAEIENSRVRIPVEVVVDLVADFWW